MFKRWFNWLKGEDAPDPVRPPEQRPQSPARAAPVAGPAQPEARPPPTDIGDIGHRFRGRIESGGPGKNVLVTDGDSIDDTGTLEALRLCDDSPLDPDESVGIDPYNSGEFDRSRNWNSRFRD